MSGAGLTVGLPVIEELVRLAAVEVPGVARVGRGAPAWCRWAAPTPVQVTLRGREVSVELAIVARPAQPLGPLTRAVRIAATAAIERLLTLELASLNVVVDGVGS
jgi:uncharacterized alkaline shock family protein YloU